MEVCMQNWPQTTKNLLMKRMRRAKWDLNLNYTRGIKNIEICFAADRPTLWFLELFKFTVFYVNYTRFNLQPTQMSSCKW